MNISKAALAFQKLFTNSSTAAAALNESDSLPRDIAPSAEGHGKFLNGNGANGSNGAKEDTVANGANGNRAYENGTGNENCNGNRGKEQDINNNSNARHCEMIKFYFLDHYVDLLTFLEKVKNRNHECKQKMALIQDPVEKGHIWKRHCDAERDQLRKRRTRIRPSNFNIIKQIGQGGYGQVFLCRKKDNKELCALKKMSKKVLYAMGESHHILTERDILARADSPWLVKLFFAFQDIDHVYLVMEYVPGGDFRTLLNASGILHGHHAQFYFAEMCTAVFTLHKLGYVHRDLKPENFLLDAQGHIKLADFGLSRGKLSHDVIDIMRKKLELVKSKTFNGNGTFSKRFSTYQTIRNETRAFSVVGSPDYMAIEILTQDGGKGYDHRVDYWSLGCILFEAVCGYPPFTAQTADKVWINLYNWKKVLERPVYSGEDDEFNLSDECWDLISKLICTVEDRYSSLEQVQNHSYFQKIKFDLLRSPGQPPVPLIPKLQSETDTAYFDDFTCPGNMALYTEIQRKESKNKKLDNNVNVPHSAFVGFTFNKSFKK